MVPELPPLDGHDVPMLARPPCFWCFDEDAQVVGQVVLPGASVPAWALLCAAHWEDLGDPGTGRWLHHAAELGGDQLSPEQVAEYIEAAPWVYARTMPKHPHEYVLLRRSHDPWTHLRFLAYIREHGELRPRRSRRGTHDWSYWTAPDGREYWTMRSFDTILNRERDAPADDDATEVE